MVHLVHQPFKSYDYINLYLYMHIISVCVPSLKQTKIFIQLNDKKSNVCALENIGKNISDQMNFWRMSRISSNFSIF